MNTYALLEDSMRLKDLILCEIDKNKNRPPSNSFCSVNALKQLNSMLDIVNHEIRERSRQMKEEKILGKKRIFRTFHYERQYDSKAEHERRSNMRSVEHFKRVLPNFLNDILDHALGLGLNESFNYYESVANKKDAKAESSTDDLSLSNQTERIESLDENSIECYYEFNKQHHPMQNFKEGEIRAKDCKDALKLSDKVNDTKEFVESFSKTFRVKNFDDNSKKSNSNHDLFFYNVSDLKVNCKTTIRSSLEDFSMESTKYCSEFENPNNEKELEMLNAMNGFDLDQETIDFLD